MRRRMWRRSGELGRRTWGQQPQRYCLLVRLLKHQARIKALVLLLVCMWMCPLSSCTRLRPASSNLLILGLPLHRPHRPVYPVPLPLPGNLCRLRAALNSTQGGPAGEPFFPLGLTPASADPSRHGSMLRGGRGAKRASSVLRRDSESGMASER